MRPLFTTMLGEGHLNPLIPLAQALTAAGNEVAFACARSFCPMVESRGFRAFPMGLDWSIGGRWSDRWTALREIPDEQANDFIFANIFAGEVAERALPDLLAIAHAWSPDIIVRESTEFGGWLAAEILGLPHASVEVTIFGFHQQFAAPVAASLARILDRAGRPTDNIQARLFAHLHLAFVPPSFQDPAVPLPVTAHALRTPTIDPLLGEVAPPWFATLPDRPVVYATGGTIGDRADFFNAIVAGVRELDVTLVATLGRAIDPARFGSQLANVHLAGYVSQALLLPRCAVVVTHGGFSSVLGALACGVPLVTLADGAARPVNARRAAALGTAIALEPGQHTPEAIRAAVRTVLGDPSYRQRAREVRDEIRALPGPERGVALLTQLAAGHTSPATGEHRPAEHVR